MKKDLWVILFTFAMIAVILFCIYSHTDYSMQTDSSIRFAVNGTDIIRLWSDEESGAAYVFLPSYTVLEDTTILIGDGMNVSINGKPVTSGMDCSAFEPGKEYRLDIDGNTSKPLRFLLSANTATMYVDTVTGRMDMVNRDKSHKENARIRLYTPDGKPDYLGEFTDKDKIRGHGNISTWELDKKSYNLYLHKAESLLSMGKGNKYVLLANRTDKTNLRNKIILDFARKTGSYDSFSSDCEFVELYLNKEYYGLYLLCRSPKSSIEKGENNDIQYFWETELTKRAERSINSFEINTGISVEVIYPGKINKNERNYLIGLFADMQTAMMNPDGINTATGKYWYDYIDMDSWARKYLIEEVFMNYDAVTLSQFYYLNSHDGKIYTRYCWDYDNTLGIDIQNNVNCFLAQRLWKDQETYTPWYHFLWKQNEFREYVISLYNREFLPELQKLSETGISDELEYIKSALNNNSLRWNIENTDRAVEQMGSFLNSRIEFLNSAWVDRVEYKTITLIGAGEYRYFCTPAGTVCSNLPSPEELGITDADAWTDMETGEIFDENTVITEDITLYAGDMESEPEEVLTSYKITILSLFLFMGMFAFALACELRNRRGRKYEPVST